MRLTRKLHWQILIALIRSAGFGGLLYFYPPADRFLATVDKSTYITFVSGLATVVALFCSVSFGFILYFMQSNRAERLYIPRRNSFSAGLLDRAFLAQTPLPHSTPFLRSALMRAATAETRLIVSMIVLHFAALVWLNSATAEWFVSLSLLVSCLAILLFVEFAHDLYRHVNEEVDFLEDGKLKGGT